MTAPDESSVTDMARYERHRALVRETDRKFATVYGAGGAAVLGAGALVLVVAWLGGGLNTFLPWILAVTAVLLALFGLRVVVKSRRDALHAQVQTYCELNNLDWQALCAYYESEGLYPYFLSLFTDSKSRA